MYTFTLNMTQNKTNQNKWDISFQKKLKTRQIQPIEEIVDISINISDNHLNYRQENPSYVYIFSCGVTYRDMT